MKLYVVRKKASSLWELGRETVEIPAVSTLEELLTEMVISEFRKRQEVKDTEQTLTKEEIEQQGHLGRVRFQTSYQENMGDVETAVQVMLQDFEDGLFRIYLNGEECLDLKGKLAVKDEDEVVLIRLVMLAGRMW